MPKDDRSKTSKQANESRSSEWLPVVTYLAKDCRGQPPTNRWPLTLPPHNGWRWRWHRSAVSTCRTCRGALQARNRTTSHCSKQGFRHGRVRSVDGLSHSDIGGCMKLERQALKSARPVILAQRARLHISPKVSTRHLQIFCNAEAQYWASVATRVREKTQ
jgi:hypothetical protein